MNTKRPKTLKYKNYEYSADISDLLEITLSDDDFDNIEHTIQKYKNSGTERGYEYIIEDLYILVKKHAITTSELSRIYRVGVRTIQIWLKELGLNRDHKEAFLATSDSSITRNGLDIISGDVSSSTLLSRNFDFVFNSNLPPLVIDFLNYLETIKGKSKNTIDGYRIDLTLFFRFIILYKNIPIDSELEFEEIPIDFVDANLISSIKLTDLYAFLSFLEKKRNNSSYARARKVATLKSFFKFLHVKAKVINENPTLELESPKINKRHPIYLTLDQSVSLLSSLKNDYPNYYRDYCILVFFLNCGLRLSELCTIDITKIKGDTLTIIGKGNKERTIYLNESCISALSAYMNVRDISKCTEENRKFLFISSRNLPINKRTVELLVKKHIDSAGLHDENYTPHKLRHTAATLMYKHGNVDIRSLQNILGHENISTTQIYTHVDDEKLRSAVNSNPLAKIK